MYGKEACTSQMATLRKFQDGRMDIIRLPSLNSAMFTNQFNDPEKIDEIPRSMMATMLRIAILQHQKYSLEVMNGRGIDQHLLGLKMIAKEYGKSIPEILETKAYQKMMAFTLSTSKITTQHNPIICGPSASDCYGICYNLQPKQVHFTICALHSCKETDSSRFAKELENALVDIYAIITKDNERGK
ncbi:unnamed protein product [Onchocerca ochengi]|uniref:Carn_acyltransf domain-containing protein n=1 Tax=Onchocerca ochengi TaxID=42157 RepID=A0A182EQZ6_ONCOC|nr:unnamed protein product [Onchocerca ochengi]